MTNDREWDAFVRAQPESSFCHLSGWRQVFSDVMGHQDASHTLRNADGVICGVLPLVWVRSRILGHYLVSMPFLNHGGAVGAPEAVRVLLERARDDALQKRVDILELRGQALPDAAPALGFRPAKPMITVRLPLAATQEESWRGLHRKVRAQVLRAQRAELSVHFGPEQREAFYEVFAHKMRRLGRPLLPKRLFARIARQFPKEVEFGVVRRGDEPVAAGCGFLWRNQFELTWAAALPAHRAVAPNMLLHWAFCERARALGAPYLDLGRCTAGSSSHAFKRQWGGGDIRLHWSQWAQDLADCGDAASLCRGKSERMLRVRDTTRDRPTRVREPAATRGADSLQRSAREPLAPAFAVRAPA